MLKNNQNNFFFFFLKLLFILLFSTMISACGKTFSGVILEKEANNKTYIEPDGRTFYSIGFAKKVDIQPYITINKEAKGLIIRGEYDKFGGISILGLDLNDGKKNISTECDKRYSRSFIKKNEVCDGLVANKDIPTLEKILQSSTVNVTFHGEKDSLLFEMTDKQKEVFMIILKKYSEL